jgi:hypothetical protein
VENWPVVDCLISFHSKGFPLDKAINYANLRNPFIINNLPMQYDIQVYIIFLIYNIFNKQIPVLYINENENCNRIAEEFTLYWRMKVSKFHDMLFSIEIRRIQNVSY